DRDLELSARTGGSLDDAAVVVRDRRDECRLVDLGRKHRPVDVEVRAVRREAVRDPDQPVGEPTGEGWVVREVAVDVVDPELTHLDRHAGDLRKDPQPTEEEVRTAPGLA